MAIDGYSNFYLHFLVIAKLTKVHLSGDWLSFTDGLWMPILEGFIHAAIPN